MSSVTPDVDQVFWWRIEWFTTKLWKVKRSSSSIPAQHEKMCCAVEPVEDAGQSPQETRKRLPVSVEQELQLVVQMVETE